MQERIEPPILISRLMTFVMASALVVLVVLVITLDKMFPLNRPQVFFLTTQEIGDKELTLTGIPDDLEAYKNQFIREYVRYRNEIVTDLAIMRARWTSAPNGIIKARSTDAVFGDFVDTDMVDIIRRDYLDEAFKIKCDVEFLPNFAVVHNKNSNNPNAYTVKFTYVCSYGDLDAQKYQQPYVINVTLEPTDKTTVKWSERIENPLGLRVKEYKVLGQSDPLNWIQSVEYNSDTQTASGAPDSIGGLNCDGQAPDANGCCPGEIYTNMGELGFNCCPSGGGDCFAPYKTR